MERRNIAIQTKSNVSYLFRFELNNIPCQFDRLLFLINIINDKYKHFFLFWKQWHLPFYMHIYSMSVNDVFHACNISFLFCPIRILPKHKHLYNIMPLWYFMRVWRNSHCRNKTHNLKTIDAMEIISSFFDILYIKISIS